MKEIMVTRNNRQLVVSSRDVAKNFGKRHDKLLSEINRMYGAYIFGGDAPKMVDTPLFYKNTYIHPQNGQRYPEYLMNRDGFTLLVMGFTGKKAMAWKIKYIEAFNVMERELANKQNSYMIADPVERAKRWIEEQKERHDNELVLRRNRRNRKDGQEGRE